MNLSLGPGWMDGPKKHPAALPVGIALVALALIALPFVLASAGTAWVRITNLAMLYVLLSLGLNIVVGYAGLLDLGYVAFYAVGAYVYALLASPHFNIHWPFWVILPIGALVAAMFGILLGAPTLKLRGDYLAIVTLGFGEIVRIFLNNLSSPVNITNGPRGIARIDPFRAGDFNFSTTDRFLGLAFSGPIKYYYLMLAVMLVVIFVNVRLQNSPGAMAKFTSVSACTPPKRLAIPCADSSGVIAVFIAAAGFIAGQAPAPAACARPAHAGARPRATTRRAAESSSAPVRSRRSACE